MVKYKNPPSYYLNRFLIDILYALIAYKKNNDLYVFAEHFVAARWKDFFDDVELDLSK